METKFRCERHPDARLLPVGKTREGGLRLICARCSGIIVAGRGTVSGLNRSEGLGTISPDGGGNPLVFLMKDTPTGIGIGCRVNFEFGILGDEKTYIAGAMRLRMA